MARVVLCCGVWRWLVGWLAGEGTMDRRIQMTLYPMHIIAASVLDVWLPQARMTWHDHFRRLHPCKQSKIGSDHLLAQSTPTETSFRVRLHDCSFERKLQRTSRMTAMVYSRVKFSIRRSPQSGHSVHAECCAFASTAARISDIAVVNSFASIEQSTRRQGELRVIP